MAAIAILIAVRNGKVYQVIHFSHVGSVDRQSAPVAAVLDGFAFTAPSVAAGATPAAANAANAAKPAGRGGDGLD